MNDFVEDDEHTDEDEEQQIDTASRKFQLELTALFVTNALRGRSVLLKRTPAALCRYRIFHSTIWRVMFAIAALTNLALALIEEPMYKPQETNNWLCPPPVCSSQIAMPLYSSMLNGSMVPIGTFRLIAILALPTLALPTLGFDSLLLDFSSPLPSVSSPFVFYLYSLFVYFLWNIVARCS